MCITNDLSEDSSEIGIHALMIIICVIILLPLYVAFSTSVKQPSDVFAYPYKWVPSDPLAELCGCLPLCSFGPILAKQRGAEYYGYCCHDAYIGTGSLCVCHIDFVGKNSIFCWY